MRFLRLTPLRLGLLLTLLAAWGYFSRVAGEPRGQASRLIRTLDWRVNDRLFAIRGKRPPTGRVLIVEVDEKSLQEPAAGGLGQWPWPRSVMAQILLNLSANGARVIGLDFVYAEEDRTSPKRYVDLFKAKLAGAVAPEAVEALRGEPDFDHDATLAAALETTPTILGYFVEKRPDNLLSGEEHGAISSAFSLLIGQYKDKFKRSLELMEKG